MILKNHTIIACVLYTLTSPLAQAFPENTRLGYSSCQSCHVSPTGGGLLTEYGRRLSEEKISTFSSEKAGDFLLGTVPLPKALNIGGDIRYNYLKIDNDFFTYKRSFLMQAELELSYAVQENLFLVASFGSYDEHPDTQQHYVLFNLDDNFVFRLGKFMPAFGLQVAEHNVVTRKPLHFNEGNESYNLEAGYFSEIGEILIDGVFDKSGEELFSSESGATFKTAYYLGKNSQIGMSALSLTGPVNKRTAMSGQFIVGMSSQFFLLSDYVIHKTEALKEENKANTMTGIYSYNKLGWEAIQGFLVQFSYEHKMPDRDNKENISDSFGPVLQWFPYPHFELWMTAQQTEDKMYGQKIKGNVFSFMGHYYF